MPSLRTYVLVLAAATGCAPALSSFQPAHVGKKGTIAVATGVDLSAPTGSIGKIIDTADTLSDTAGQRELTEAERDQMIDAGITVALAPPAPVTHFGATYVPATDWEVGLRYASGGWRLGIRRQLLKQAEHGIDLTIGLGASRFAYSFPVDDLFGILKLDDFKRYTIDVPVAIGQSKDFYRWWAGPRFLVDSYGTQLTFTQPPVGNTPESQTLASVDGTSIFAGGQAGVAVGYKHLYVAFEMTVVKLFSTAQIAVLDSKRDVDIGGTIIYPGVALMGNF